MTTLLHIDTSARRQRSVSRALAEAFVSQWRKYYATDKLIYRDVGSFPPEFVSEEWIAAAFVRGKERTEEQKTILQLSDTLIKELIDSNIILISTPMYNYGIPAALKAWFDQVIRVNKTFTFDLVRGNFPLEPTLSGRALVLLSSCGEFGFEKGGIREGMDHLSPYIRTVGKYLGVEEYFEVRVEYQEFGDERHAQSLRHAYENISTLVKKVGDKYRRS